MEYLRVAWAACSGSDSQSGYNVLGLLTIERVEAATLRNDILVMAEKGQETTESVRDHPFLRGPRCDNHCVILDRH